MTGGDKGLRGVTRGYKGLHGVTRGYRELQGANLFRPKRETLFSLNGTIKEVLLFLPRMFLHLNLRALYSEKKKGSKLKL